MATHPADAAATDAENELHRWAGELVCGRLAVGASPADMASALLRLALETAVAAYGPDVAFRWLRKAAEGAAHAQRTAPDTIKIPWPDGPVGNC